MNLRAAVDKQMQQGLSEVKQCKYLFLYLNLTKHWCSQQLAAAAVASKGGRTPLRKPFAHPMAWRPAGYRAATWHTPLVSSQLYVKLQPAADSHEIAGSGGMQATSTLMRCWPSCSITLERCCGRPPRLSCCGRCGGRMRTWGACASALLSGCSRSRLRRAWPTECRTTPRSAPVHLLWFCIADALWLCRSGVYADLWHPAVCRWNHWGFLISASIDGSS